MNAKEKPIALVNVTEAAAFLRVSRSKLYMLMAAGELPFVKFGKSRRVLRSDLVTLIERNTRSAHRNDR